MNIKTSEAGNLIDCRCTKCKILTIHTVVAMVAGKVARVKCNTCDSEHNYHSPKAEKTPLNRRATVAKVGKLSVSGMKKVPPPCYPEQWNAALAGRDATTAAAYQMEGNYVKHTLIAHLNFGVGIVTSLSYGKMEVLFKDGPKWLCCR